MNFSNLSRYLDTDEMEVFYRIKRFEHEMYKLLIETESEQNTQEVRFNKRDINIITAIALYCRNNNNLIQNDSLLEIILLYYSVMEIFSEKHTSETLENYFQIPDFTHIIFRDISFFSKPYHRFYLLEKSII